MTIEIRDLRLTDHAAWLPLWQAYLVFYEATLPQAVTVALWARLLDPAERIDGALAWDGETAVGMAHWLMHSHTWAIEDIFYLNDLFVIPSMRGEGVGRRLIEHVYRAAADTGCPRVYWMTHETNTTAQALYNRVAKRTGFIQYSNSLD